MTPAEPIRAVLIALVHAKTPHRLRKPPSFGHEHASQRDEFVFLCIIEGRVQGFGGVDHLPEIGLALREAVRLRESSGPSATS